MLSECLALLLLVLATPECAAGASELHFSLSPATESTLSVAAPNEYTAPVSAPSVGRDALLVGGATAAVALLNPDVRRGVFTEGSLSHIARNFRHPIERAVQGGREDDDAFIHNRIAHPLSWGGIGYYLRRRGYSRHDALLFTQVHSIVWEYIIEGSYQKPSGKDLVTNFVSAATAILLFPDGLSTSTDPPGLKLEVAF